MKKIFAAVAGATLSFAASAGPAITLPPGPLYLNFDGLEQIAVAGTTYKDTKEINWGVFVVDSARVGAVSVPGQQILAGSQYVHRNASPVGADKGGQITGMFYGIEQGEPSLGNPFPGTKGFLDLYWRDLNSMSQTVISTVGGSPAGVRTAFDQATGFTEGTFLARLYFDTGMDPNSDVNTITGSVVPNNTPQGFNGFAHSYASVDMSKEGLWSYSMNGDWFSTGEGGRDLRFSNTYSTNKKWNGTPGILGAQVSGTGQAYLLPEPGALSLMGLAMIGMGLARRRNKQA